MTKNNTPLNIPIVGEPKSVVDVNHVQLYAKSDKKVYTRDNAGVESPVSSEGTGGGQVVGTAVYDSASNTVTLSEGANVFNVNCESSILQLLQPGAKDWDFVKLIFNRINNGAYINSGVQKYDFSVDSIETLTAISDSFYVALLRSADTYRFYVCTDAAGTNWSPIGQDIFSVYTGGFFWYSSSICYGCFSLSEGGSPVLHKTINGGQTWAPLDMGITDPIRAVYFLDANIGFASSSYASSVYKTIDGGQTWTVVTNSVSAFASSSVQSWVWLSQSVAILITGDNKVWQTSDGGQTWTTTYEDLTYNKFYGYGVVKSSTGVLFAYGYKTLLRSTDNGSTWSEFSFSESTNSITAVVFNNTTEGYAIVDTSLWVTYDYGITWSELLSYGTMYPSYVAASENGVCVDLDLSLQFAPKNDSIIFSGYAGNVQVPAHKFTLDVVRKNNRWYEVGINNKSVLGDLNLGASQGLFAQSEGYIEDYSGVGDGSLSGIVSCKEGNVFQYDQSELRYISTENFDNFDTLMLYLRFSVACKLLNQEDAGTGNIAFIGTRSVPAGTTIALLFQSGQWYEVDANTSSIAFRPDANGETQVYETNTSGTAVEGVYITDFGDMLQHDGSSTIIKGFSSAGKKLGDMFCFAPSQFGATTSYPVFVNLISEYDQDGYMTKVFFPDTKRVVGQYGGVGGELIVVTSPVIFMLVNINGLTWVDVSNYNTIKIKEDFAGKSLSLSSGSMSRFSDGNTWYLEDDASRGQVFKPSYYEGDTIELLSMRMFSENSLVWVCPYNMRIVHGGVSQSLNTGDVTEDFLPFFLKSGRDYFGASGGSTNVNNVENHFLCFKLLTQSVTPGWYEVGSDSIDNWQSAPSGCVMENSMFYITGSRVLDASSISYSGVTGMLSEGRPFGFSVFVKVPVSVSLLSGQTAVNDPYEPRKQYSPFVFTGESYTGKGNYEEFVLFEDGWHLKEAAGGTSQSTSAVKVSGSEGLGKVGNDIVMGGTINSSAAVDLRVPFEIGAGFTCSRGQVQIYDSLILSDGRLLIVGFFDTYNGVARTNAVILEKDGSIASTVFPDLSGVIYLSCCAEKDGSIYVGASRSTAGKIIFKVSLAGVLDTSFASSGTGIGSEGGGITNILLLSNGNIFCLGYIAHYNDASRGHVLFLNSLGNEAFTIQGFSNAFNWYPKFISEVGGKIFLSGFQSFGSFGGVAVQGVMVLELDGTLFPTNFDQNWFPFQARLLNGNIELLLEGFVYTIETVNFTVTDTKIIPAYSIQGVHFLSNGCCLIFGSASEFYPNSTTPVFRLLSDYSYDPSFDVTGVPVTPTLTKSNWVIDLEGLLLLINGNTTPNSFAVVNTIDGSDATNGGSLQFSGKRLAYKEGLPVGIDDNDIPSYGDIKKLYGSVPLLRVAFLALYDSGNLAPNTTYFLTDKGIFLYTIADENGNSVLCQSGKRLMLCPTTYLQETKNGYVFKGVYDLHSRLGEVYNTNECTIYGGRVWISMSDGNTGSNISDDFTLSGSWVLAPYVAGAHYSYQEFDVKYDVVKDRINEQSDKFGNVVTPEIGSSVDYTDRCDWGIAGVSTVGGGYVFCDNHCSYFMNNCGFSSIAHNRLKGDLSGNSVTYIMYNNVRGSISQNRGVTLDDNVVLAVTDNTDFNEISGNRNNGLIVGCSVSVIKDNINNGDILNNSGGSFIISNANNGAILNCISTGYIQNNKNNGYIRIVENGVSGCYCQNNVNNGHIYVTVEENSVYVHSNTNNGAIQKTTTVNIEDTIVNKL